jgi:hypothetical protein
MVEFVDGMTKARRNLGATHAPSLSGRRVAAHRQDELGADRLADRLQHLARRGVAAGYGRWEAAIRGCLLAMRERGQLVPSADPDQLATALLAALQGGLLLAQIERSVRPLAAALDAMITLIGSMAMQPRASGHRGS